MPVEQVAGRDPREQEVRVVHGHGEAAPEQVDLAGLERELVVVAVLRDAEPPDEVLAAPDQEPAHRAVLVEETPPAVAEHVGQHVDEVSERLDVVQDHRAEHEVELAERREIEGLGRDGLDRRHAVGSATVAQRRHRDLAAVDRDHHCAALGEEPGVLAGAAAEIEQPRPLDGAEVGERGQADRVVVGQHPRLATFVDGVPVLDRIRGCRHAGLQVAQGVDRVNGTAVPGGWTAGPGAIWGAIVATIAIITQNS